MRFETFIVHAGEGYLPDHPSISQRPLTMEDLPIGYGYNSIDKDDFAEWIAEYPKDYPVIVFEGTPLQLEAAFNAYLRGCSEIRGADDDHYDYFPSNFDAVVELARFLDANSGLLANHVARCQAVWDKLANQGSWTPEDFASEITARP